MNHTTIEAFLSRLTTQRSPCPVTPCTKLCTPFNSVSIPAISVLDYVRRLVGECGASVEGALACLFIKRLLAQHKCCCCLWGWGVTSHNVHRLFLAALLVATKYTTDSTPRYLLHDIAARGGVSASELAHLEVALLALLNFQLYVPAEAYEDFIKRNNSSPTTTTGTSPKPVITAPQSLDDYHHYHYNNAPVTSSASPAPSRVSPTQQHQYQYQYFYAPQAASTSRCARKASVMLQRQSQGVF